MNDIAQQKRQIRLLIKTRRAQMVEKTYLHFSEQLNSHLIAYIKQHKPQAVKGFIPHAKEPDIWHTISYCWSNKIPYLIPKCIVETKQMHWYAVTSKEQLIQGAYNIIEPNPLLAEAATEEAEIVLVPALAFTKSGDRLGYGGGYYDRFYEATGKSVSWVGIAFSTYIEQQLPTEEHDFKCDYVITNEGIIDCKVEEKEDYDGIHAF